MKRISKFVVLTGLAAIGASADIHYVNLNNPNPSPPYANWTTAATNIQAAIRVALLYDLGGIPVQTVQTGRVIAFTVYAPELDRQADFTCRTTDNFKGLLAFDSRTHTFSYTPSPNDQQPFYVTFTATAESTQRAQTVEFRPVIEPDEEKPPATFLIGEIPPQTAWIGTNRSFYVAVYQLGRRRDVFLLRSSLSPPVY